MNIAQLEYALSLQKFGNFTKSSINLGITQPALSLQIKSLEEEIGITLFDRSKTPVEATSDGVKFLKRAQEIVVMSKGLRSYADSLRNDFNGVLKLGIIPTLAPYLVPLFSNDMRNKYPGLSLDIKEALTEEILELVISGELDAGIVSTPLPKSSLIVKPIIYEYFFYYKQSQDDFNLHDLWLLEEGNCFRDQVNDICGMINDHPQKNLIYRSNSIDSLIRMVDNFGGMTILPELTTLTLSDAQDNNTEKIDGKVREISIVSRNAAEKDRFINALEESIQKNIPHRMQSSGSNEIVDPGIKKI